MNRAALATAALLFSCALFAESANGRFESLLGFKLNATNLTEITKRLGEAERFDVPEGHHEYAICYRVKDSPNIIVFSSGAEFGSPEEKLLGLSVLKDNLRGFPCSTSTILHKQILFDGLRMGLTEKQFRALVGGSPKILESGDLVRFFESERSLSETELKKIAESYPDIYKRPVADVTHSVWGRFKDGLLIGFGCWRIETL